MYLLENFIQIITSVSTEILRFKSYSQNPSRVNEQICTLGKSQCLIKCTPFDGEVLQVTFGLHLVMEGFYSCFTTLLKWHFGMGVSSKFPAYFQNTFLLLFFVEICTDVPNIPNQCKTQIVYITKRRLEEL